jgi:heptosyltransferase-2
MNKAPLTDERPRTVVLLQFTGIGDLVWHIVYFKAVAAQSKGGQVAVVAQPSTLARHFLAKQPWVEQVIDHDHRPRRGEGRRGRHAGLLGMWRMGRELKAGGYERIVLFSGRTSRGLIAAMSGIADRRGYGYRWLQRLCLNHGPWIEAAKGPGVAAYPEASAFAVAHGFTDRWLRPELDVPEDQLKAMGQRVAHLSRPLYSLAIGTSEVHKQWGLDRFAELATRLVRSGAGVVVLGGPAEREAAQQVLALVPEAQRQGVCVITDVSVHGSAAVLQLSDACVGNDTGMVNVAAAVGTRTLVLLGNRPPLTHDPLMEMVLAPKLSAVSVDQVEVALRSLKAP